MQIVYEKRWYVRTRIINSILVKDLKLGRVMRERRKKNATPQKPEHRGFKMICSYATNKSWKSTKQNGSVCFVLLDIQHIFFFIQRCCSFSCFCCCFYSDIVFCSNWIHIYYCWFYLFQFFEVTRRSNCVYWNE